MKYCNNAHKETATKNAQKRFPYLHVLPRLYQLHCLQPGELAMKGPCGLQSGFTRLPRAHSPGAAGGHRRRGSV